MSTQFVLLDFENVQPRDVALLQSGEFSVKVFLGVNQRKVPLEMVRAIQTLGSSAEYIEIEGSGRNALDFHIAYYIGQLAAKTPGSSFYIISKDAGFDPLIKHLETQGIACKRSASIAEIIPSKPSNTVSIAEMADAVTAHLVKLKAAKPRKLKTLQNTIKALFRDQADIRELDELIHLLRKRGVVGNIDGNLTYELPS